MRLMIMNTDAHEWLTLGIVFKTHNSLTYACLFKTAIKKTEENNYMAKQDLSDLS